MRIANVEGRAVLLTADDRGLDVYSISDGRWGPSPSSLYDDWSAFRAWAADRGPDEATGDDTVIRFDRSQLGPPSPHPRQILGVARNYDAALLDDTGGPRPAPPDHLPPVFTKYPSSLTGPDSTVELPAGGSTDWEVEVVVVIGQTARHIAPERAWDVVAGICLGQDLSERRTQSQGSTPQFSLAKSFPGFAPTGPWLTTPDELADPDDIRLGCANDGTTVQNGRTRALVFSIPTLISRLTQSVTLLPGDLVFTGTPDGVGQAADPPRFLQPGDTLDSWAEGIGELHQAFQASTHPNA